MEASPPGVFKRARRPAIAGILVAMLLFAMLFTIGVGYFALLNAESEAGNSATATSQNSALGAAAQQLVLNATLATSGAYSGDLILSAYNDGGVSASISAVYIESAGQLVSKSPSTMSPYLISSTDLPSLSNGLPESIAAGASTNHMKCGTGTCNIAISSSAYSYTSGTVTIYVLTSAGNTFDAQYPPTNVIVNIGSGSTTITTSTTIYTSTVVSTTTSTLASSTSTLCNGSTNPACNGNAGLAAGTNSLVVTMAACAGPASGSTPTTTCTDAATVYQGGEVILTATIDNFAAVSMSVYLNLVTAYTNGVTVANESPWQCPGSSSSTTVAADSGSPGVATIYCTYLANQGSSGGTVTFIAYATGTYTGSSGPITITSAESTSNPQQVGNFASTLSGPWSINYFSFSYQSKTSGGWTPLATISESANTYVAMQVQLTNTANSSLTILQYSYLLVGRNAQEMDFYAVQSVNYPGGTPTIVADSCVSNEPSAPSGSPCSPAQTSCSTLVDGCVPVGDTTSVTFAACYPGSTDWQWENVNNGGNNYGGNCSSGNNDGGFAAPEGVTMFINIVYDQYNAGKWYTFSQAIPFYGVFVSS